MKKSLLIIFFLSFFCLGTQAQITLTADTHTPQVGDFKDYFVIENPVNDLTQGGPDQVWDFSGNTEGLSAMCFGDASQSIYYGNFAGTDLYNHCLLYTSPSPRDLSTSRMPSSA